MAELKDEFTKAIIDLYRRTKVEIGYSANRFLTMVNEHGGVETARRLVHGEGISSQGMETLWEKGRLDLSVEAQMLRPEYAPLFDKADLDAARAILRQYGNYMAPWDTEGQQPDNASPALGEQITIPPAPTTTGSTSQEREAPMIPPTTREDLLAAMELFDQEGRDTPEWRDWQQDRRYEYAIEENGRLYPVKEIIRLATDAGDFSDAEARNVLVEHGFVVQQFADRDAIDEDSVLVSQADQEQTDADIQDETTDLDQTENEGAFDGLDEFRRAVTTTNRLSARLMVEYPTWLQRLEPRIHLGPYIAQKRLDIRLNQRHLQRLTFNINKDLYVKVYNLWPEDIQFLHSRLDNPAELEQVSYPGIGAGGEFPHRFYVKTERDYQVLQELAQRQVARLTGAQASAPPTEAPRPNENTSPDGSGTSTDSMLNRLEGAARNVEDSSDIEDDDDPDVDRPPSPTAPTTLEEWQAQYTSDNPFMRRLAAEYPLWLQALDARITFQPATGRELYISLNGRLIQDCAFNRKWDLYVWLGDYTDEDLALLRQGLSDPASLKFRHSQSKRLDGYRFFVHNDQDYELLKQVARGQVSRPQPRASWPPVPLDGPAFVVLQDRADDYQRYGESYRFTLNAAGSPRRLWDAALAFERGGPPVYLIIYRPGPHYAFTAWARVSAVLRRTDDSGVEWMQLTLEQHEFAPPQELKGNAQVLMQRIEWLRDGLSSAFSFSSIRPISAEEFAMIVPSAVKLDPDIEWPEQGSGPFFLLVYKRGIEGQEYGKNYVFSAHHYGYREMLDAIRAWEAGGPPLRVLIYRDSPHFAFTAWALVTGFSELPLSASRSHTLYSLDLDQHELPAPIDVRTDKTLPEQVPWLAGGPKQAFVGTNMRRLEPDEFRAIIDRARELAGGPPASLADAVFRILSGTEGTPLSTSDLLNNLRERNLIDATDPTPALTLAGVLLGDKRFVSPGNNLWMLAGGTVDPESGYWRVHFPRELWTDAHRAGVIAIDWALGSTNQSVQRFKRIKQGDRVVAYVQGGTIGGVGIVTRPMYDIREQQTGNPALFGGQYAQRIDVSWDDEMPEPKPLLDQLQERPALYNKLKNPNTVVPLTHEDYKTLLVLLDVHDDGGESRLPSVWDDLINYFEFMLVNSSFQGTAAQLFARARLFEEEYYHFDNPMVDQDEFVEALRQFRLLMSADEANYRFRPYVSEEGFEPRALWRLMVLALLVPVEGAVGIYILPARQILPRLESGSPLPLRDFAPELGADGLRLLSWYAAAGLVAVDGDTWQPAEGALQPLDGDDEVAQTYNLLLKTLRDELAGNLTSDLEPAGGPLPRVVNLDERLDKLGTQLLFDPRLVRRIYRSLLAGRHVVLTGPPGTGKTELAKLLPTLLWREDQQSFQRIPLDINSPPVVTDVEQRHGYYPVVVTATEEWSVRDVVGGIAPKLTNEGENKGLSYDVQYGHVTRSILHHFEATDGGRRLPPQPHNPTRRDFRAEDGTRYRGVWLVIDELTRAPVDAAFGSLLTALGNPADSWLDVPSGDFGQVRLPLPPDFRIIGTLNSFDRHFLNQISEAMKRRFDFIDVMPPGTELFPYEQGVAAYQALRRMEANALLELTVSGDPPIYTWEDRLNVRSAGVGRYTLDAIDSGAAEAIKGVEAIFRAIRVFRQLGTAQLMTLYADLFAGVVTGIAWDDALDGALADSLADQLQVLSREEQRILLAFVKYAGDSQQFSAEVRRIFDELPRGRQSALLQALAEAESRDPEEATEPEPVEPGAFDPIAAAQKAGERLVALFDLSSGYPKLPQQSLFRRRLYSLISERGL